MATTNLNDIPPQEKQMQNFVKQMLVTRLFIGTFQEKRYVEAVQSYRDVIVISDEETELIRDLEVVKKRLQNYHNAHHWIGITSPDTIGTPAGYCLWVELPEEVFGKYWYKISRIKFHPNETLLRLKIIRPISTISNTSVSLKNLKNSVNFSNKPSNDNFSINELQNNAASGQQLKELMTLHNTTEAIKFMFLLLIGLCSGLLKVVEFLGNFTIKLMNELSFFIKSITPIIIACINLIAKIIGGFYLLILSMWRDRKGPPPVYNSPYVKQFATSRSPYDQYNTVYYRRALPPPQRNNGGVKITPLD